MKKILGLFLILLMSISLLIGCSKSHFVEENVTAIIESKKYTPSSSYTEIVYIGKTVMLQTRTKPAKYEVYIKYNNVVSVFNNKELYGLFDEGSEIKCRLVKKLNSKNEINKEYLELGWKDED